MKGDFSRLRSEQRLKHDYLRVLMQQGRVQLDADWNEQVALLLYRLERLAEDLIGPFGGPQAHCGFEIQTIKDRADFTVSEGRYYVGGLLCENAKADVTYATQRHTDRHHEFSAGASYLVYLDAWEEYVNAIEDPDIREVALGVQDTAGRSRVAWSVRTIPLDKIDVAPPQGRSGPPSVSDEIVNEWPAILPVLQPPGRGWLNVQTERPEADETNPCIVSPAARFRGLENQLYRVEIHAAGPGGTRNDLKEQINPKLATFKWSRENGSVVYPIVSAGRIVVLANLTSDPTLALKRDDWVELIDDDHPSAKGASPLYQVDSVDAGKLAVTLKSDPHAVSAAKHAYLRRWDQRQGLVSKGGLALRDGAAVVVEDSWLTLEAGLQIRFERSPNDKKQANVYRTGDYWNIAARTSNDGAILWPSPTPPDGVFHRYAPLAVVTFDKSGQFLFNASCLWKFDTTNHSF
jgi:hypothetical protein